MPIYDQSYAHWQGRLEGHGFRWLPITLNGIRLAFRSKFFLILFILALSPFVVRVGMIVLFHTVTQVASEPGFAELVRADSRFYFNFLFQDQAFGVVAMCLFAGAPLIARDLKAGALEVYFSKPLYIWDYLIGKLMIIAFFIACMTLFPALFLFLLDLLFSEKEGYLSQVLPLLPGIFASAFILILVCSSIVLACSSLARTARTAAVSWFAFHVALLVTTRIGAMVFNERNLNLLDISTGLRQVAASFCDCPTHYDWPTAVPLVYLALLIVSSLLILLKKIRGVEVIRS